MKQFIYIATLIFAFCFTIFAQVNENSCRKIIINAPESIQQEDILNISASFENETQPTTTGLNWTIILGNDVSNIKDRAIVNIDSKQLKDSDSIIVLAESPDEKCQNAAMAKIVVVPGCGLPFTIDEYGKIFWNEEKARLDAIASQMEQFQDMELVVFFSFDKKSQSVERKNHLKRVLNYLYATRRFEQNRITFLISESESERIYFQPLSKNFSTAVFDDYFVIKGEDFDKIDKLFQSKPIIKKRKK